jgi:Uma2 family endonuclease
MRYHGDMPTVRKPPKVRMTLAEFLTWEPGDPTVRSWQLIDGETVAMAPGSDAHGAIQAELAALLRNHLLDRRSPCRVVTEPGIVPKLRADRNYRIPDIGVTCAPPSAALMLPEPILLIEILSPSNEVETWANVWTYASIPSVAEILVVHSTRVAAEMLRREPNGQWPDEPVPLGSDDMITLTSIGFGVPLRDIYRTTVLASP